MDIKYYEVELGNPPNTDDTFPMCIKATFNPSKEDVEDFLKEDLKNLGYTSVVAIDAISHEDAKKFYDLECEDTWPILTDQYSFFSTNGLKISGTKEALLELCENMSFKEDISNGLKDLISEIEMTFSHNEE